MKWHRFNKKGYEEFRYQDKQPKSRDPKRPWIPANKHIQWGDTKETYKEKPYFPFGKEAHMSNENFKNKPTETIQDILKKIHNA